MRPTRAEIGQRVMISDVMMAPAAGDARSNPKPSGPDRKNIAGKDRQQRHGVAEQDRKQIEEGRAKENLVAADKDDAAEQRFEIDRCPRCGVAFDRDAEHDDSRGEPEQGADRKDNRRAERDQEAAERRSGDDRGLRGGSRGGDGTRQEAGRHDIGQNRLHTRLLEGAAGADDKGHGKKQVRRKPAVRRRDGEDRDSSRLDDLADEGNVAPVVAIRDMAGRQEETRHGEKLHQPDQAEIERAAGQFIHLPADRDDLDLQRNRCRNANIEKAQKGGMVQQRCCGGRIMRHRRRLYSSCPVLCWLER